VLPGVDLEGQLNLRLLVLSDVGCSPLPRELLRSPACDRSSVAEERYREGKCRKLGQHPLAEGKVLIRDRQAKPNVLAAESPTNSTPPSRGHRKATWGFLPNAPKRYSWASRRQSNIAIDGHSGQPLNDYVHVQKDYLLQELVAPVKIDVLPGDGELI
jgi:hypothetical protein